MEWKWLGFACRRRKRIVTLILSFSVTLNALVVWSKTAEAGVRLCNKAPVPLYTASAYSDNGAWTSEGWWKIWPDECAYVTRGKVAQRYYYAHAHSSSNFWVWGDDPQFCVDLGKAFNLSQTGNCTTRTFFRIDTGAGQVTDDYTQNLTCPECKLPKYKYDKATRRITAYQVIPTNFADRSFSVPVTGIFDLELDEANQKVKGTAKLLIDWGSVQKNFGAIAQSGFKIDEECGDRFSVNTVKLRSAGNNAEMTANASYARWLCTSMDLPQTTCGSHQECINKPPETVCWTGQQCFLGMCTDVPQCELRGGGQACTDVPDCTTRMVTTRTSKNVVLQQGGSVTVSFRPYIAGQKEIRLSSVVTDVHLDGFGQSVVNLLRINLKDRAQGLLDTGLDPAMMSFALPDEIRNFTQLREAHFYDQGDGELGMIATGTIDLRSSDLLKLCHDFWPSGKCEAR
ncbi:putative membrane protein [Bradyrhizobium huanghuaihaiense]|uniref:Putative membrane protein n=1 Tax=Bradyrhizobium huanghuaihaiense TaxID=990078 RepID=A0A562QVV4_9BRAD|nr:DUF1036 domain-containing protein [Bradyrhizobium huanghuaihaiense]TWI60266.1 putative membrane protein [Bradyrhizobium huanghuaihaiense]